MATERQRVGRRALTRIIRTGLGGVLAVGVALATVVAVPSITPATSATTDNPSGVSITLLAAPSATGIVRNGEPVSVRVTLTNTGETASGPIALSLAIDPERTVDAAQLADWFEADPGDSEPNTQRADESQTVAGATVSSLDPGGSAVLDLIVPADTPALAGPFGARLAIVRATVAGELIGSDRTALVWTPDDTMAPITTASFVAPISTPGESSAFLSADELAFYTAEAGPLTRLLDGVAGRPVLLAIDPRVIASIRLLGAQAPASATAFLERLARVPNETFLLPWADANEVVTLTAAETALPSREGTGVVRAADGGDGDGDGDQGTPSSSPDVTPTQTGSLEALTEWPTTLEGWSWVGEVSLTNPAVAALGDQGSTVLIVAGSSLERGASLQAVDAVRIIRADDAISHAARDASLAESQQQFDRSLSRLSALLAASADRAPGDSTVITLSRDRLAGTDRLIDTVSQTVALPWVNSAVASSVLTTEPITASFTAPVDDEALFTAVRAALAAESADRLFANITVTPAVITDLRRLELLSSLSRGWGARSSEALQGFVAESDSLRSSVQVVESSDITLLADRASLPVTVQNQLDVAVRVFVRVNPDSAQLRVTDTSVETLVEPRSQTRALVPVESLTNGQVGITVSLHDGEARPVGEPTRVSLNLQAGWETAGTIAVAVALVLLLTFGIARDIRKRRRRRAEVSAQ